MSDEIKEQLIRRLKSFAWRVFMAAVVFGLDFLIQYATALNIPDGVTIILGFALGEVTKYLNRK